MAIFRKNKFTICRFEQQKVQEGYNCSSVRFFSLHGDVQILESNSVNEGDGFTRKRNVELICDEPIYTENTDTGTYADCLKYDGTWFKCLTSMPALNTPLRRWFATFQELQGKDLQDLIDLEEAYETE